MDKENKILIINLGSTSSKIALYINEEEVATRNYNHEIVELQNCKSIFDQIPLRVEILTKFLSENNLNVGDIDLVVPRYPITFKNKYPGHILVNKEFIDFAKNDDKAFHIMFISPLVAWEVFGDKTKIALCDFMSYIEAPLENQITGIPSIKRENKCHVENVTAISRKLSIELNKPIEDLSFVVGHLGGGVSFSWFNKGRVRYAMFDGEASFSPERGGVLPGLALVKMCFDNNYSKEQIISMIKGSGGLSAYFNTTDCREIEKRISDGDDFAKLVYTSMGIRMAACIGEVSAVAKGKVDVIVLTGGIANSKLITGIIKEHIGFIAPIKIYPGEFEMEFFANFGLEVIEGTTPINDYVVLE